MINLYQSNIEVEEGNNFFRNTKIFLDYLNHLPSPKFYVSKIGEINSDFFSTLNILEKKIILSDFHKDYKRDQVINLPIYRIVHEYTNEEFPFLGYKDEIEKCGHYKLDSKDEIGEISGLSPTLFYDNTYSLKEKKKNQKKVKKYPRLVLFNLNKRGHFQLDEFKRWLELSKN